MGVRKPDPRTILTVGLQVAWAIANEAYRHIACAQAGHPGMRWVAGVRRCGCGQRYT